MDQMDISPITIHSIPSLYRDGRWIEGICGKKERKTLKPAIFAD
jgi:hypothetical protein